MTASVWEIISAVLVGLPLVTALVIVVAHWVSMRHQVQSNTEDLKPLEEAVEDLRVRVALLEDHQGLLERDGNVVSIDRR